MNLRTQLYRISTTLLLFALFALFAVGLRADPPAATFYQFNGGQSAAVSSGTSVTLSRLGCVSSYNLTLGSGTAAYTDNLSLSDSGIHAGDVYLIAVSYPASTNPSLNVFDSGTAGTLLDSSTGTAIAGSTTLEFVNITGTAWVAFHKGAVLTKNLAGGVQAALGTPLNSSGGFVTGSGLASGTAASALSSGSAAVSGSATVAGSALTSGSAALAGSAVTSATAAYSGTAGSLGSGAFGNLAIYSNQLSGIHQNSNLSTGGGTDDRATLQAALNAINAAGGGTLIMTGPCLLSGSLALWSNERIEGLNEGSCGFYLSGSSNTPVLTNMHRSYLQASDSNICAQNLTINGDGQIGGGLFGQAMTDSGGNWVHAIDFNGVNNIEVSRCQVLNSRNYAINLTSCNWVKVEHIYAWFPFPSATHEDAVHLDAPYNDVFINDIWSNGLDDAVAINGDEDYGLSQSYSTPPLIDTSGTNSSRVRVSNITAAVGCNSAVRIISGVGRADDIVVSNVHGVVRSFGVLIDDAGAGYAGNFGSITLSDIDLGFTPNTSNGPAPFTGGPYLIGVLDQVDSLTLRNIGAQNYDGAYGPWLCLGSGAHIRSLSISGLWHDESFSLMASGTGRIMAQYAWVHEMHIGPLQWDKPESSGSASGGILMSSTASQIDDLEFNGVETNNGAGILLQTSGTIGAISVNGLRDLYAGAPSITLSDTTTNVTVGSAEVGQALISGTPASITGTGNVITDGTGSYPAGRHVYACIYHLNENSNVETAAFDSSGNFAQPLLLGSSTGTNIYRVTGQIFGNCYNFPGSTSSWLTGRSPISLPQQFWLSYWVKYSGNATGSYGGICCECTHNGMNNGGFQAILTQSGTTYYPTANVCTASSGAGGVVKTSAHAIVAGSWHFIVQEEDGVNGVEGISVDGNAMETGTFTPPILMDTKDNFAVGSSSNDTGAATYPLNAYLCELVFHPGLPTSGDISAIWNGGTGLQAPYP